MNKSKLSKYYFLTIEIKDLEEKIETIQSTLIGSSKITGMPHGGSGKKISTTEKNAELLVILKNKLENRKAKALKRMIEIEDFLLSIEDVEIRMIFNKRYLEMKKWENIANEMYMSERNVIRLHSNYLKARNQNV